MNDRPDFDSRFLGLAINYHSFDFRLPKRVLNLSAILRGHLQAQILTKNAGRLFCVQVIYLSCHFRATFYPQCLWQRLTVAFCF